MPAGGSVTLATRDVMLGDTEAARLELEPGPYVLLSVSDTGTGMSEDVKARLFEPFFTTKGVGKGTGLGLAMVYGAIKQSGGGIDVRSELGRGTEFRLYWPRVSDSQISVRPPPLPALERGSETIMVVEDEQMVRALASTILERQGYHVVACASGAEALALMKSLERQPVDLLLTDLVMPGMSGRELAERVVSQRPNVRVLYTSGYTEDVVIHRGIADDDMQFLAKPYSVQELSRRVREVLDASARS
jgi:CheY-like chemotaxis protein